MVAQEEEEESKKFDSYLTKELTRICEADDDNNISGKNIERLCKEAAKTKQFANLNNFKEWWTYGHHHGNGVLEHDELIGHAKVFNCDTAVDEYYKKNWTIPKERNMLVSLEDSYVGEYEESQSIRVNKQSTNLAFAAGPSYKKDFVRRVTLTSRPDVLICPALMMITGPQINPSFNLNVQWLKLILKDLFSTQKLEATFNGMPHHGCMVVRKKPLKIYGIPSANISGITEDRLSESNNSIEMYHGGYYIPLKGDEKLTPGDHELVTIAEQPNYKKYQIISLKAMY
jgi:hypothetical protein